MAKRRPALPR